MQRGWNMEGIVMMEITQLEFDIGILQSVISDLFKLQYDLEIYVIS